jgi:hypothetical protein
MYDGQNARQRNKELRKSLDWRIRELWSIVNITGSVFHYPADWWNDEGAELRLPNAHNRTWEKSVIHERLNKTHLCIVLMADIFSTHVELHSVIRE